MRTIDQLVFVGLNGYAVALDRDTGEIVWSNDEMKSGYVTLLLDGDRLIVSTNGYIYCLDPLTGADLLEQPHERVRERHPDGPHLRPRAKLPHTDATGGGTNGFRREYGGERSGSRRVVTAVYRLA